MNRDENQFHYVSKRERLLAIIIFLLMLISFFIHLCAFTEIFLKNTDLQINLKKNKSDQIINEKKFDNFFHINFLPLFCILAHLIWTIVPIVILDQCFRSNNKSISRIILKLFLCTCPLLFSSELSLIFVCHIKFLTNDFLIITIKWLIFISTILISFWTGILSDKNKWRGIHGGQIAPELHSPLYRFQD